MKKYVKPEISFQELNLTTNISAGCSQVAQHDAGKCIVEVPGNPGMYIFQDDVTNNCNTFLPNPEDFVCYHVPTADTNVFES